MIEIVPCDRFQRMIAPWTGHCRDLTCSFAIAPGHHGYRDRVHRQAQRDDDKLNYSGKRAHESMTFFVLFLLLPPCDESSLALGAKWKRQ